MHLTTTRNLSGLGTLGGEDKTTVRLNTRHNGNVTFGEVLSGEAVFVADDGKSVGLTEQNIITHRALWLIIAFKFLRSLAVVQI